MGISARGEVVLVPFPFSDLSKSKMRPAVVLACAGYDDWVLCQITSNPYSDAKAIELNSDDFSSGALRLKSYARPGKLFTANGDLIHENLGILENNKFDELLNSVIELLKGK